MHTEQSLATYQRVSRLQVYIGIVTWTHTIAMQKPPQSTSLYTFIGTQPSSLSIVLFSLLMSSNISLIDKTTSTLMVPLALMMPSRAASLVIQLAEDRSNLLHSLEMMT